MSADANVRQLGLELWEWRLPTQFRTSDDIPRVDRPRGWLPSITPASVEERLATAEHFRRRWEAVDRAELSPAGEVDHRLLGSALARVRWECELLRNWERDAVLLAEQAIGPYFDLLLRPPPFREERVADLAHVLANVPAQLEVAQASLARAGVRPLAAAAVRLLSGIEDALPASIAGLEGLVGAGDHDTLTGLGADAAAALASFRGWLSESLDTFAPLTPIGRDGFVWFLRHVALHPGQPEDLVTAAWRELDRATVWEAIERNRHRDAPQPPLPATAAEQVEDQARREREVRAFYEQEGLLTQPARLRHYLTAPMPPYLAPISWLGVTDDLTGDDRLAEDGVSYTPEPGPDLPYFYAANARDPRLGIVHEGAHYQQLALAWAHPNPLRRRYYDSLPNEGIAFYNEEFLLQAGLFEDAPRSREVIHNFNKLRSLRVIVDVNLATGAFSLEEGVAAFVELVPMDEETAFEETASYTANPGHAMTYLVGKQQILALQAELLRAQGEAFSLRAFHDRLWLEGNVPLALQRFEVLGDRSELEVLDAAGPWW
ncbi:MAG: DUF885 family protein [Nitriliruptoraceae bacterium]